MLEVPRSALILLVARRFSENLVGRHRGKLGQGAGQSVYEVRPQSSRYMPHPNALRFHTCTPGLQYLRYIMFDVALIHVCIYTVYMRYTIPCSRVFCLATLQESPRQQTASFVRDVSGIKSSAMNTM